MGTMTMYSMLSSKRAIDTITRINFRCDFGSCSFVHTMSFSSLSFILMIGMEAMADVKQAVKGFDVVTGYVITDTICYWFWKILSKILAF